MKKILVEDFEKHGFEVDIIEHCEDEKTLYKIEKDGCFFKFYLDGNGEYVRLCDSGDGVFANEVTDFKDLLVKLAQKIKHVSTIYKQRSILAKIAYDKLMNEIEEK